MSIEPEQLIADAVAIDTIRRPSKYYGEIDDESKPCANYDKHTKL